MVVPSVDFHPALERCLDTLWRIKTLEPGILDMLLHFIPDLQKCFLFHAADPGRIWLTTQAGDDLLRLFQYPVLIKVIQIPGAGSCFIAEVIRLSVLSR